MTLARHRHLVAIESYGNNYCVLLVDFSSSAVSKNKNKKKKGAQRLSRFEMQKTGVVVTFQFWEELMVSETSARPMKAEGPEF